MANTSKFPIHYSSFPVIKDYIDQDILRKSYHMYVEKLVTKNAQQKMPVKAVNYVSNLVNQLIKKQSLSPSLRTCQFQQLCPTVKSNILRVKLAKQNQFRNSSINFGKNQKIIRRSSSKSNKKFLSSLLKFDQVTQNFIQRNPKERSSFISSSPVKNYKLFKHQRASTQAYHTDLALSSLREDHDKIQPLERDKTKQKMIKLQKLENLQIENQIQSLRSRKLKLEAAFSCFNENKHQMDERNLNRNSQQNSNINSILITKRTNQNKIQNNIITDYDGEVILTQSIKKHGILHKRKNKENIYKNNAVPIIRIKTQITSNYLELPQNFKSFKPSKKYLKSNNINEYDKYSFDNSNCSSQALINKKTSNPSISNLSDKGNNNLLKIQRRKFHKKSIQQSLFNIEELTKSKRIIQKEMKSKKNIIILNSNN